jgi:intein/homing endonuclease
MKLRLSSDLVIDSDLEPWRREGLRIAMLGGPGSGKSWNNSLLAEQFLQQGGVVVIFQPRDEYYCVESSTPIPLVDGRVVTAEELAIMVKNGEKPRIFTFVSHQATKNSFAGFYKFAPKAISAVSTRTVPEIIEIKGRLGRSIRGTPNHQVLITRNGKAGRRKPFWARLDEIRVGDRLVIPHAMPLHKSYLTNRLPIQNLHNRKCIERDGWIIWTANISSFYQPKIRKVVHYSPDLAEWLGYLFSDGHLSKNLEKTMFINEQTELRERFAKLALAIFGCQGKDIPNKLCYCINNKALGVFLKSVLYVQNGRKSPILKLPDCVMRSTCVEIERFTEAYIKCDGDKDRHLSTSSIIAASQLCYLIERIGKHASLSMQNLTNRKLNFKPSTDFHYRITITKGQHLAYKRKGILDTVKISEVTRVFGNFRVIGTLVADTHNMILGQTPLISHNTLKEKFDIVSVGGVHAKDMEFALTSPSLYAKAVVEDGISMIFYTSAVEDEDKLIEWVSRFISLVLKYQEQHRRPLLLILEEAQEYVPKSPSGHVAPPWTYNRMIKAFKDCFTQGRKLNIIAVASSQRPQELNFTVRQLANLTFYGKFSDQDIGYIDKECLKYVRQRGISIDASKLVDLGKGEWLVIMGKKSRFVNVDAHRVTKHGAETPKLEYVAPRPTEAKHTIDELSKSVLAALEKEEAEKSELEKTKKKLHETEAKLKSAEEKANIKLSVREMMEGNGSATDVEEKLRAQVRSINEEWGKDKQKIIELHSELSKAEHQVREQKETIGKLQQDEAKVKVADDLKNAFSRLLPPAQAVPTGSAAASNSLTVDLEHRESSFTVSHVEEPVELSTKNQAGKIIFVAITDLPKEGFTERELSNALQERGWPIGHSTLAPTLSSTLPKMGLLMRVDGSSPAKYRVPGRVKVNVKNQ